MLKSFYQGFGISWGARYMQEVGINQHINILKWKYATALEALVLCFIKMAHIGSYGLQYPVNFFFHSR